MNEDDVHEVAREVSELRARINSEIARPAVSLEARVLREAWVDRSFQEVGRLERLLSKARASVECPVCRGTGGGQFNDCQVCDGNGVIA